MSGVSLGTTPDRGTLKSIPGAFSSERPGGSHLPALQNWRFRTLLWFLFMWVVLKNTWISEDAFITYRVSDNLIHGLGMRWNPLERVQVYTHPLWMLWVSAVYFVSRNIYFSVTSLALLCSGLTIWLLLFRGLRSPFHWVVAGVIITFSKAFVDYSTSGLENSLSHLLLILFFLEYLKPEEKRRFSKMVWCAGLALLNRMDLVWFVLPALAHLTWAHGYWRTRHWRLWLGLLPYVGWELFSVLYYGFFFPNSAYVKLGMNVGAMALVSQGLYYFANSLSWDPITLFAIFALTATGIRQGIREKPVLMLAIGVLLYLGYTVKIGGDYMTGRFLTAPLIVSLLVLSRVEFNNVFEALGATAILFLLGISSPRPPIQTTDQYVGLGSAPQSVDDERGYRHSDTSLLRLNKDHSMADSGGWIGDGVKARKEHVPVTVYRNIGYYGFFAGPGVHIIDPHAISDPLLSRLRYAPPTQWSSGHVDHKIPDGYIEAAIGQGTIGDPDIEAYWEKIKLVTRGPIFGRARLREVLRFNLGLNRASTGPLSTE